MNVFILVMLIFTLTSYKTQAASDTEVLLEMDRTRLQMGLSTDVSLILRNVDDSVELVDFSGIDAFDILNQSQSNSTSTVNGVSTKEVKVTYTISPKEIGTANLQVTLKIGDQTFKTNTLNVTVEARDESLDDVTEDLFMRTTLSKDQIFFGEKAIVTYELYSRYNLTDFGFTSPLDIDGFVVESSEDGQYQPNYITINGNKYVMYEVKKLMLSPTDIGMHEIPALDFQANVGTGGFFNTSKPMYLKTEPQTLQVLPLPTDGRPADFSGLTGNYAIESSYSSTEVSEDNPLTLQVQITGSGNLEILQSIKDFLHLDDRFTVYETDKGLTSNVTQEGVEVTRSFELILIPKEPGQIDIDEASINYFDTESQTYESLKINGTQVQVSAREGTSQVSGVQSPSPGPLLVNQVTYNSPDEEVITLSLRKSTLWMTLWIFIGIMTLLLGLVFLRSSFLKVRSLDRQTIQKIKSTEDYQTLFDTFNAWIGAVYKVDLKSITMTEIQKTIEEDETVTKLKKIMMYFEHDKYYQEDQVKMIKDLMIALIRQ